MLCPTPNWQSSQLFIVHTPQQIRVLWGCKNPRSMEKHLESHPILPYSWLLWNLICGGETCPPPAPSPPRILWNLIRLEKKQICRHWTRMELCRQAQWLHMPPRNKSIYWNITSPIRPQEPNQTSYLVPQASWNSLLSQSTSGPKGSGYPKSWC